jgi:hypothetical protein
MDVVDVEKENLTVLVKLLLLVPLPNHLIPQRRRFRPRIINMASNPRLVLPPPHPADLPQHLLITLTPLIHNPDQALAAPKDRPSDLPPIVGQSRQPVLRPEFAAFSGLFFCYLGGQVDWVPVAGAELALGVVVGLEGGLGDLLPQELGGWVEGLEAGVVGLGVLHRELGYWVQQLLEF